MPTSPPLRRFLFLVLTGLFAWAACAQPRYSVVFNLPFAQGQLAGGLVPAASNRLAGVLSGGGALGRGAWYSIGVDGSEFRLRRSFGGPGLGSTLRELLALAQDGRLYGTTSDGGSNRLGALFSMLPDGTDFRTEYEFVGGTNDLRGPDAGVAADGSVLFGVTATGGAWDRGGLYRFDPTEDDEDDRYLLLRSFGSDTNDLARPLGVPFFGVDGASNAMIFGHARNSRGNRGALYRIRADGTEFAQVIELPEALGAAPGLCQDGEGTLFGISSRSVFRVGPDGSNFMVLRVFTNSPTGTGPQGPLVLARDGWLYGATAGGGTNGTGTLFRLARDGSTHELLHHFGSVTNDAERPQGGLLPLGETLFGISQAGGTNGRGAIFQLALNPGTPPVASDDKWTNVIGAASIVPFEALLANDVAAEGRLLSVTWVEAQSFRGGTVRLGTNGVEYTPPRILGGIDRFRYEVTDSQGQTARADVILTLAPNPPPRLIDLREDEEGVWHLRGEGVAGLRYRIERSTSLLTPNWSVSGTARAGDDGRLETPQAFFEEDDETFFRLVEE
jgi:uncharacterized repeat protein (TIGR03803 family)